MKIMQIFIFSLFFYGFTFAQSLELSAGANLSSVHFDNELEQQAIAPYLKYRLGKNMLLGINYDYAQILSITGQVEYISKGYSFQYTYLEGYKVFDYLLLSVSNGLEFYSTGNSAFYIFIAPYVAYWIRGYKYAIDYRNQQILGDNINFSDTLYQYNRYDAGLVTGIKYQVWQSDYSAIFLRLKYELGHLSNDKYNVSGTKNRSLIIEIGYSLDLH